MRRLRVTAVLALIGAMLVPAGARADGAICRAFLDAAGDTNEVSAVAGLHSHAADIRSLSVGIVGDDLVAVIGVGEVVGGQFGTDVESYRVTWSIGSAEYYLRALRYPSTNSWRFERSASSFDEFDGPLPAHGSVDVENKTITIRYPYEKLGSPPAGTALEGLRAESREERTTIGDGHGGTYNATLVSDEAFDPTHPFVLGEPCSAPLSADGAPCIVTPDARGDARSPFTKDEPAYADIIDVSMATNATTLVVSMKVDDLWNLPVTFRDHVVWTIAWTQGGQGVAAQISYDYYYTWNFRYTTAGGFVDTEGAVDIDADRLTILIPLSAAPLGTELRSVAGFVDSGTAALAPAPNDWTDYEFKARTYEVGTSCADGGRACPVVLDMARDDGTAVRWGYERYPDSDPTMDLLGVGFVSSPTSIRVTVRPRALAASPPGMAGIGYTVSWRDGDTTYFAQAVRRDALAPLAAGSEDFSYGIVADAGEELAPPSFDGTATTGSFTDGIVTIDVPRAQVGDLPDGATLSRAGGIAWAFAVGNTVSPYVTSDVASFGAYVVGDDCSV